MTNFFYLGPRVSGNIRLRHINHATWEAGGIVIPYLGTDSIVGLLFDTTVTLDPGSTEPDFKRANASSTGGGSMVGFWGDHSRPDLVTNRYVASSNQNVRDAFAVLATPKDIPALPTNFTYDTWAGFLLGWAGTEAATAIINNLTPIYQYTSPSSRSEHEPGAGDGCPLCHISSSDPMSHNPIRLRNGDKLLRVTDISVNTHNGVLAFTRAYVQSKRTDTRYQFMGLGWTHNHALELTFTGASPNRTAWVRMEDGGRLKFAETGTSNQFNVRPGSTAALTYDSGQSIYLLTAPDNTQYEFDASSGTLKKRRFVNGEVWNYDYVSNKLDKVSDTYGHELRFSYIGGSGFDAGQLWRVGDQTASGLGTGSPSGRYIEFGYVKEKNNGVDVSGGKALLATVRDVRTNVWSYDYYGQHSGESTTDKLNLMTKRLSPPFRDAGGSIITDSELALETLVYTLSGASVSAITQRRGLSDPDTPTTALLTTDFEFNGTETIEAVAGQETTHKFTNEVYTGTVNPAGKEAQRLHTNDYRPFIQTDENHHSTYLQWGGSGKRLEKVVDAEGYATAFSYDSSDRLIVALDAEGRKVLYFYDVDRRQPMLVLVAADGTEITTIKGDMEGVTGDWSAVGSPTTHTLVTSPVDSGTKSRHVAASAANEGIASSAFNLTSGKAYIVTARVKRVSGTIRLQLVDGSSGELETVSLSTGTDWQSLRLLHEASSNITGAKLRFLTDGGSGEFYADAVHIIEVTALQRWQEFVYDSQARTLAERTIDTTGTIQQETLRAYVASGNGAGLLESLTVTDVLETANTTSTTYTYDGAGRVISAQKISLFGACTLNYTLYDAAGNVVRTVCSDEAIALPQNATTTANIKVTAHEYDTLGRRTKTITNYVNGVYNPAQPEEDQATLAVYDALDRVKRTITNYVPQGSSDPQAWYWNGSNWQYSSSDATAIDHGTDNDQNIISDTDYNARGMVRRTRDALGKVTLYGYDAAGRLVKTVASASDPDYNNDYGETSPDPALEDYEEDEAPDKDIITTTQYDDAGNPVKTVDVPGNVTYTVYDALNRVVKTVRNAKDDATIELEPHEEDYDATNDPRSFSYTLSSAPDRDMIDVTEYDVMGRVVKTISHVGTSFEQTTLTVYDAQGRVKYTIGNYVEQGSPASDPATWVWDDAVGQKRWEQSGGTAIDHGANNDQNVIHANAYDTQNRVQYTRDVLGRRTCLVYDGLGRQIRTIGNYVPQGSSDPATWVWDTTDGRWEQSGGTAISHGSGFDENQISHTEYDSNQRVNWTRDVQGRKTYRVHNDLGQHIKTLVNCTYNGMETDPEDDAAYTPSSDADKDIITRTEYNTWGRVVKTFDAASKETRFEYDALGRRTKTITNYVDGVYSAAQTDEDLIETTTYDLAGRVTAAVDARGTKTSFTYDSVGRRLTVIAAADSPLAVTSYTCYDKAGRVLRNIANYVPLLDAQGQSIAPDAKDGNGNWLFIPPHHGQYDDRNLLTDYFYDAAGRQVKVISNLLPQGTSNPANWLWDTADNRWENGSGTPVDRGVKGDHNLITTTAYHRDGQIDFTREVEGVITKYGYDQLRRRTTVVQSFVDNGEDPALWVWDDAVGQKRWEKSNGTAITHGTNNDENIIVRAAYDIVGRMTSLRNPNGALTTYAYDQLNRRTTLTNALSKTWTTAYALISGGTSRTTLTGPNGINTQRDLDLAGRLATIQYGSPSTTPDVRFTYDKRGSRTLMSEYAGAGFTSKNRETTFGYDAVQRLTSVGFDNDGNGTVDETVSYEYDAGGLRTKLTMPGSLNVNYTYDMRGQLVSLTDWDNQKSEFNYDNAGRHISTRRHNGLTSRYVHDAGGRLRLLRHGVNAKTLAHFAYDVDGRGNRTTALEALPRYGTGTTTLSHTDKGIVYKSSSDTVTKWQDDGLGYHATTEPTASLKFLFFGSSNITLKVGQGTDHSIFDVYIDGSLWQSIDGYAAAAGERTLTLTFAPPDSSGPHTLELRNRAEKRSTSSGYKLRFKSLTVDGLSHLHTIEYTYDKLARLLEARYNPGLNTAAADADLPYRYQYTFDRAGNRTNQTITENGGTPNPINFTYNAANQPTLANANAFTYDNNGNMASDGANAFTWDRANRLLTMAGGGNYAYDGLGHRIKQGNVNYTLDLNSPLPTVIAETFSTFTTRYLHSLHGIHAAESNTGVWSHMAQDGLGTVRVASDNSGSLAGSWGVSAPYGGGYDKYGSMGSPYGYTGEWQDGNGLLYLRARYFNAMGARGLFTALDPYEGTMQRPMSLNGYSYVEGNPVNLIDLLGLVPTCPVGLGGDYNWDCEAVNNVYALKQAFLDSAARHNRLPYMDNNAFAALIASLIVGETRIGRIPDGQRATQIGENLAIAVGCIVSGHLIEDALKAGDIGLFAQYWMNVVPDDVPDIVAFASVGIGNIKIATAANLWRGLACNAFGECTSVEISPLRSTNYGVLGDIVNPLFSPSSSTGIREWTEINSYQLIGLQLLDYENSIEYAAGILEAGALRAMSLNPPMIPTAWNSALWYNGGVQTQDEIERIARRGSLYDKRGHVANWVLPNISIALQVLELNSVWQLSRIFEPEYCDYTGRC